MTIKRQKIRPWMLRKEIMTLYYGLRDKRTSVVAAIPAILSVIYLVSPIDLIPDFIPFFGYLDDVVIVPLLLSLSIRLLPEIVRTESLEKVKRNKVKFQVIFILSGILVLALLAGIIFLLKNLFFNH